MSRTRRAYTTVSVLTAELDAIKAAIKRASDGGLVSYQTPTEFVRDAIRRRIEELERMHAEAELTRRKQSFLGYRDREELQAVLEERIKDMRTFAKGTPAERFFKK